MSVTKYAEAPKVPSSLNGRIMHSSESVQIIHLCLSPGEIIEPHINSVDVVACLIEGNVLCQLDGLELVMQQYDTCFIKSGASRGFTNTSAGSSRLLMVKKLQA